MGIENFPSSIQLSQEEWLLFLEECSYKHYEWFVEYWMTNKEVPPIFKNDWFSSWLSVKKQEFLSKELPYKEELIARTWDSSRTLDWILDHEQKKYILEHMSR